MEAPASWLLLFFWHDPISLGAFPCFRVWQNIPDLPCIVLAPNLDLVLQGTLVPFSACQYLCVVTTLMKQNGSPTPDLVGMSRLMTHRKRVWKVYYLLNEAFWGEQGSLHKLDWKWFVRAGRRPAGGFMVVRGWGWYEGLCAQAGACVAWTSHQHQRWKHSDFLIRFPGRGAEGEEGGMRFKMSANIK